MKGKKINRRFASRRGQSVLLSHAILVGFSIFLIYAVTTTFVSLRDDYQEFIGGNEIKQLCFVMNGAIEKIYNQPEGNLSTYTLLGSLEVRMPEKIVDVNYRAKFINRSILIESIGDIFNDTCTVGYEANYNGSTVGGLTRLSYYRASNGTNVIEMVRI